MRRLATVEELRNGGWTRSALRWAAARGQWRRITRGVYGEGPDEPSALERRTSHRPRDRWCRRRAAGWSSSRSRRHRRHQCRHHRAARFKQHQVIGSAAPAATSPQDVAGVRCTDGVQTLVDLAQELDDAQWEQALESGLRRGLASVVEVAREATGQRGVQRVRRVLALRPLEAPPTESLLETLMVQLIRAAGLPEPVRQYRVFDESGRFVARVDLCWPDLGVFVELDGQQHKDQPVYDANRETAVVGATGWLCARFTWRQVVRTPRTTARQLTAVLEQAQLRAAG